MNQLKLKLFLVLISIAHSSFGFTKVSDLKCEDLISKYSDEKYNLRFLAGLYANRNCKGFTLDYKLIPDSEKRIFRIKFDELDPDKKTAQEASESLDSLKKNFKKETDPNKKFSVFKKIRQKFRSLGKKDESIKFMKDYYNDLYKKASGRKKDDYVSYFYEISTIYGKALWNDQKTTEASQILNKSLTLLKKRKEIPIYNIYFLLAKMNEEISKFDTATENYDLTIESYQNAQVKEASFDIARVQWNEAWMLYRNSYNERAEKALTAIIEKTPDVAEKSRAQFFLAKLYKRTNKNTEAEKLHNANIKDDFFSFYSLASYHELGKPVPSFKSLSGGSSFPFDLDLDFMTEKDKAFLKELIKNEEPEMSERACFVFSKNEFELVNSGLYVAKNISRFNPLFTGFARIGIQDKKDVLAKYPQYIFPRVYESKVSEMSTKTSVPTELIYSIMKQESGFNPFSRSPADAYGLMQVIPRLAKTLAKKYKVEGFKLADDLYNPDVNIELGVYELKDQVAKQNGQLSFVASAYNAGPNALLRWVNREPITDMFEFIENIPYDETRTYVKIIARNLLFYQRISNPEKEINFPEAFIKTSDARTTSTN